MAVIIHTQYMENYGVEEGFNYWKFKWGTKYVVKGTDNRPANAVAVVMQHIAKFNSNLNYSMEYVHSWELSDAIHEKDNYVKDDIHETHYEQPFTVLQYNHSFSDLHDAVAPI